MLSDGVTTTSAHSTDLQTSLRCSQFVNCAHRTMRASSCRKNRGEKYREFRTNRTCGQGHKNIPTSAVEYSASTRFPAASCVTNLVKYSSQQPTIWRSDDPNVWGPFA